MLTRFEPAARVNVLFHNSKTDEVCPLIRGRRPERAKRVEGLGTLRPVVRERRDKVIPATTRLR